MTGGATPVDREAAFVALFDAYYVKVMAYARRRIGADVAKDVVADTFVTAWQRLDDLRGDPLLWLYGLARGSVANHRRRLLRAQHLGARAGLLSGHRDQGDPADEVAWHDTFAAAFAQLGESDQEVLRLVAWEGLEPTDAAAVLGCSTGAFKVRLHRARRRLSRYLALDVGGNHSNASAIDSVATARVNATTRARPGRMAAVPKGLPCP